MLSEDFFGRIAIIFVMTVLVTSGAIPLFLYFRQGTSAGSLAVVTQLASTAFLLLQLVMTIIRLPPKGTAQGIEPRITSVAGTFMVLLALTLTPALKNEAVQVTALGLVLIGTASSIFCLYWLGRSFSLMATARRLVTTGPYSIVRHPLYICEAVFVLGMILSHFSMLMVGLGAFQFFLQYRRARNEESILEKTFPKYGDYARRVPMILPGFLGGAIPDPGANSQD
ncbi:MULTISPECIES: isoprenylcysteine carboxylmethyltransferase family protein [unclassified Mesorhizobium]|uniref:methyltransferase family protein n=1 Tax=unclassified Mesorhizobium TaxID=325217 RepID=UPI000FCBE32C|nr:MULTISPECIES: isoprenylcysteine carboxylmethyltransferase family protein [unclassified Mesorhizobium]RUZ89055.1 isoprenylcysteine carboxylmethyltransferase family protein [Mesorhizobium sp. M7A.F.Ca.US.003.02.2.1]RUZ00688.1 isoprenylcysteine carboxylmethyltransferase family protein [Mesorhizobium sp. M7A.F.Ca.CA.001.12.2.1]RUZ29514.1 isoprenylcysteine carboxylmethyltransferase family protein [Mesorhizobium sp. M7A.F.Ca.US.007.01.2.1]RUZ49786.1 isoprenylcysteine carboxylmethyltransferase fami